MTLSTGTSVKIQTKLIVERQNQKVDRHDENNEQILSSKYFKNNQFTNKCNKLFFTDYLFG